MGTRCYRYATNGLSHLGGADYRFIVPPSPIIEVYVIWSASCHLADSSPSPQRSARPSKLLSPSHFIQPLTPILIDLHQHTLGFPELTSRLLTFAWTVLEPGGRRRLRGGCEDGESVYPWIELVNACLIFSRASEGQTTLWMRSPLSKHNEDGAQQSTKEKRFDLAHSSTVSATRQDLEGSLTNVQITFNCRVNQYELHQSFLG